MEAAPDLVAEAIVGLEPAILALGQDDASAHHPIRFLTIDQMTDIVERAERVATFGAALE